MAVVGVGVGDICATGGLNAAIPGGIKRFALSRADIQNVAVPLLKLPDDGPFILWRAAVDDDDLQPVRNRLRRQVLKTTPDETLGVVG